MTPISRSFRRLISARFAVPALVFATICVPVSCKHANSMAGSEETAPIMLNEMLGFAPEDRIVIINADDVGLCRSENRATFDAFKGGLITSGTVMVPCPQSSEAFDAYAANPDLDLGVHLTLTAEWGTYRWGTVLPVAKVPSLVDDQSLMWRSYLEFIRHAKPEEVEIEMRAQIDKMIGRGLKPTHIDSHMGCLHYSPVMFEIYLKLAKECDLPMRIGSPPRVQQVRRQGIACNDHLVMIPYDLDRDRKLEAYQEAIANLKPGITELILHLAYADEEGLSISSGMRSRESDLELLGRPEFKQALKDNNVRLIGYRELLNLQRSGRLRSQPAEES
jgi:predicted glycoside hydrolase/deacetylase ChbG (UPF0249 family)